MNKKNGILLNIEKITMKFEDGTEKDFTKIEYALLMRKNTENRIGLDILTCYVTDKAFDLIKKFVGGQVEFEIEERPTKNGSKYVIISINNVAF